MSTKPVTRRPDLASTDEIQLDEKPVDLGKAVAEGIVETDVRLDKPLSELAEKEQFLRDMVEVHFAEPATENETPIVEVTVNGQYFFARRGETKPMPRYMLEVLARSKVMRVRTERRVAPDGSELMEARTSYSPSYPFTVVHDPAGHRGIAWLKNILQQPG